MSIEDIYPDHSRSPETNKILPQYAQEISALWTRELGNIAGFMRAHPQQIFNLAGCFVPVGDQQASGIMSRSIIQRQRGTFVRDYNTAANTLGTLKIHMFAHYYLYDMEAHLAAADAAQGTLRVNGSQIWAGTLELAGSIEQYTGHLSSGSPLWGTTMIVTGIADTAFEVEWEMLAKCYFCPGAGTTPFEVEGYQSVDYSITGWDWPNPAVL